jgi:alkaline phosphatase D
VASGVELARQADAHSVHAIARGLRPDAEYFYRFRALGEMSTVARRHEGDEAITLADYRQRYAQYKTDPDLQAAHLIAPWVVAPDDHEVEDNYAGLARADDYPHLTTGQFRARRAAAYQAYYENMPLRPANSAHGAGMALYRRIRWGRLATFHMLDTRQFRDDQVCGDLIEVCPDADRPDRTITGAAQERWLLDGLARHLGV